jgi:hypothetical protein
MPTAVECAAAPSERCWWGFISEDAKCIGKQSADDAQCGFIDDEDNCNVQAMCRYKATTACQPNLAQGPEPPPFCVEMGEQAGPIELLPGTGCALELCQSFASGALLAADVMALLADELPDKGELPPLGQPGAAPSG